MSAPAQAMSAGAGRGELASVIDQLLRDRRALVERLDAGDQIGDLASLARSLVIIAAVAAAVFGAAIGSFRGGPQIAYAAIKLPAVLLLTCAVCAPSWTLLRRAFGSRASMARDLLTTLLALAMSGLVLVGLAPVVLVGVVLEVSYHSMALALLSCALLAGGAGVAVLVSARSRHAGDVPTRAPLAIYTLLLVLVGAQMAWTLRPYLVRPQTETVPFVRDIEGGVISAAVESWRSARGIYEERQEEDSW